MELLELLVFRLMNLGPGTQSLGLGLEHLSLDSKCGVCAFERD